MGLLPGAVRRAASEEIVIVQRNKGHRKSTNEMKKKINEWHRQSSEPGGLPIKGFNLTHSPLQRFLFLLGLHVIIVSMLLYYLCGHG